MNPKHLNKNSFILIVLLFFFFPACRSDCTKNSQDKCVEFSGQTIHPACNPQESNDCTIKDALVVNEGEIAPIWEGLTIRVENLPQKSWSRVEKSDGQNYELTVYPHVGKPFVLGSHDFEIHILIKKTDRAEPVVCSQIPQTEIISGSQSFKNGPFDIELLHRVNYFYPSYGGRLENPNPSTPEVKKILKSVLESIRIGNCPSL